MADTCPERTEGMPHEFQAEMVWEDGRATRLRCLFCGRHEAMAEVYGRAEDCTLRRRIPVMVPAPGIVIDVETSFDLDWAEKLGVGHG